MSDALPNESTSQNYQPHDTPTWIWAAVGAVVLIALAAGGFAGFQAGQQVANSQNCQTVVYPDSTFWLLGALVVDRNQQVMLDQVASGGPADSAGLRSGDRLLAIAEQPVNSASEAKRVIANYGAGAAINVTIERGSRVEQYTVLLGGLVTTEPPIYVEPPIIIMPPPPTYPFPLPPQPPDTFGEKHLGVYYKMIQPGDPFSVGNGALLISVWDGSAAATAGLGPGDIIVAVNNRDLSTSYTLEDALNETFRSVVSLTVLKTSGEMEKIRVRLES